MRDMMMLAMMFLMVPLALSNSFAAYLLWGYTSLLVAKFYMFGFMYNVRYNLIFAAIALGMLIIGRLKEKGVLTANRTIVLLVVWLTHGALASNLGYEPSPFNEDRLVFLTKGIIFCLATPFFLTTRVRIHAVLVMLALGLGVHGVIEGLKVISSGGSHHPAGIPNSSLSDNNLFAVGMAMVLPIMAYLSQYSDHRLSRLGFLIAFAITILSVLGTHSRGGFLSIGALALWFILTSRHKTRAIFMVAVGAFMIWYFAPESWFARMSTIENAEEDGSFLGRVAAWQVSTAIALQHPIFGAGFHGVEVQWIWNLFKDAPAMFNYVRGADIPLLAKASHSIYFQVLGDTGFVGFFIYMALLINALYTGSEIKRLAKKAGNHVMWVADLGDMIRVSLVAFMVGGGGVGLAYYELPYILFTLLEVLKQYLIKEAAGTTLYARAPKWAGSAR